MMSRTESRASASILALGVLLLANVALAQSSAPTAEASPPPSRMRVDGGNNFACSIANIGDVDGDGFGDIVAGHPGDATNGYHAGAVCVHSGRNGSPLWAVKGSEQGARFGIVVGAAGDVNGDAVPDVLVTANAWLHQVNPGCVDDPLSAGAVFVLSGKDGAAIDTIRGDVAECRFGSSIESAGDWDRDGRGDLLIGAPGRSREPRTPGRAFVYSLAQRKTLAEFVSDVGRRDGDSFGCQATMLGDVNGDHVPDVAISDSDYYTIVDREVAVYSGKDRTKLFSLARSFTDGSFGTVLRRMTDVDGDGVGDLLIGSRKFHFSASEEHRGSVHVVSGMTGDEIVHLSEASRGKWFGHQCAQIGDVDGDRIGDVVVSAVDYHNARLGTLRWYSAKTGELLRTRDYDRHVGTSLCVLDDIDGDGVLDFAAGGGSPELDNLFLPFDSVLQVISGKSGEILYTVP